MAEKMEDLMNLNNQKKDLSVENKRKEILKNAYEIYNRKPRPKYVWGAVGPNYYDCSGFTQNVFKKSGINIKRVSDDQSKMVGKLNKNVKELKPGDLVFYGNSKKVTHVAIYIGNNQVIESGGGGPKNDEPKKAGEGIRIRNINSRKDFRGGISLEELMTKNKMKDKNTTKNKPTISKSPSTCENTLTGADNQLVKSDAERLEKFYKYIFDVEGGYSNHKNDNGGATKYGIIEKEARKHGYTGDMRDFPKEMAKDIYKKDYYLKNRLNEVKDDRVALSVFDWAVNGGSSRAVKEVQKVLNEMNGNNDLAVDGIIGKYTLAALNGADPEKLLKAYQQAQSNFYDGIVKRNPSQKVFLKGWHNRLAKRENFIKTELAPSTRKNLSEVKNEFSSQAKTETNQKKMGNNIQKQR